MPARLIALLVGFVALSWATWTWADFDTYSARYSIFRNGKITGMLDIELRREGDRWEISSQGRGTHGLARILRASDRENVEGRLVDGRYLPEKHNRHTRVAGIDNRWDATFDWKSGNVTVVHDGDETYVLPLDGGALDPLTMKLEMRRQLVEGSDDLHFLMVEEDEIDAQTFRVLDTEWLETSLGCLKTIPIEKVRNNKRRYTRAWHASELGNIEVRLEHGKTGGDHMEMRITKLTMDDVEVQPRPGCAAMQAASPGD
ncbi:MAG: DUF3108 domain-containing protein [Xanthomonadales bacterium]|nr:DUF3108 domain-containing protein [Gammaproteobacteria bacterium]MBT8050541.1 DUF3108 domain-containing protein [Gammaproteobacteria bacterium]MBT8056098.1 DUF3108 domain-containing protein [Gammaproteobacteria bacterium]NNL04366.1 DUF3108 domain-containing protein [Xanthomonadales bacterium]